ncbi:MAG TPA: FapA family protein [Oscillospiraceae bacterium]|nr:FapA family protein [Oscillospiraceae bacterium]
MDSEAQESLFNELGLDQIEEIEEEAVEGAEGENTAPEEPPTAELNISTDNMTATIKVKTSFDGQVISPDFIHNFLVKNRIIYGICDEAIKEFCENKKYYLELICARGLPPVDEENATLEFFVRKEGDIKPKENEDGTVDFRELGLVQNVSKGDVLCRIVPPKPGHDGIDIYDNVVRHTVGQLPSLPAGTNTEITEDTLSLIAAVDGCAVYKNSIINVEDVFTLRGDVDNTCGNINFNGSVMIQGDVKEGFYVKAGADISIRGMVEGAFIEAGGNISISNGMNGMTKGTLTAGGNVIAKYLQNVSVACKGDVYADVIMNCHVTAEGSVILKGKQALLIGGQCQAGLKIQAGTIGSSNRVRTEISIVSDKLNTALYGAGDSLEELQRKLSLANRGAEKLQKQIDEISSIPEEEKTPQQREVLKALTPKQGQFATLIEMIENSIKELAEIQQSFADYKIVGLKVIYPGTRISIANYYFNIENEYNNSKFYADTEHIVFAPILPSDTSDEE